ncbi:ribbon-helix-helix protein, CopG family [Halorubrum tibetense]|uniref:Ribbon-helix-helix protein, CopG family n=1 Tax=Halorubrum tibetense TaxID=175631 RepID=A0ABD5SCS9_9EURY
MDDVSVSVPAEQYERLDALAAARGVEPEVLLSRLIEDAYQGHDPNAAASIDLPLGVCDGDEPDASESEDAAEDAAE